MGIWIARNGSICVKTTVNYFERLKLCNKSESTYKSRYQYIPGFVRRSLQAVADEVYVNCISACTETPLIMKIISQKEVGLAAAFFENEQRKNLIQMPHFPSFSSSLLIITRMTSLVPCTTTTTIKLTVKKKEKKERIPDRVTS